MSGIERTLMTTTATTTKPATPVAMIPTVSIANSSSYMADTESSFRWYVVARLADMLAATLGRSCRSFAGSPCRECLGRVEQQRCCHRVDLTAWPHRAAREVDFPIEAH